MEIRAESAFRPNQEDGGIVYALSGSNQNIPDKIHYLASNQIVLDSSHNFVSSFIESTVKNILDEREDIPCLVVHIHTHPMGIPNPSESDKKDKDNIKIAETIKNLVSGANSTNIIFGVHAISSGSMRQKTEPKASMNKVRWTSMYRGHEVGFYDENGKPYRVGIIE